MNLYSTNYISCDHINQVKAGNVIFYMYLKEFTVSEVRYPGDCEVGEEREDYCNVKHDDSQVETRAGLSSLLANTS